MAKICPKHDVAFQEGGVCWCCEKEKEQKPTDQKESNSATVIPQGGK